MTVQACQPGSGNLACQPGSGNLRPPTHGPHARVPTLRRPVTEAVAMLSTGSGGLTLGRAGFPPAGRQTKLHGVIAESSNPNRPAVPSRTLRLILKPIPEPKYRCDDMLQHVATCRNTRTPMQPPDFRRQQHNPCKSRASSNASWRSSITPTI